MIPAVLNEPFDAVITGAPEDRIGDITFEVFDLTNGNEIVAPSALAITQPRPGTYVATRTINVLGVEFMGRWVLDLEDIGDETIAVTKYAVPAPGVGVVPTSDEIADIMFARTKTGGGTFLGSFTPATMPTNDRVDRLVLTAYQQVFDATGEITDPDLILTAKNAIKYFTGMLIELSSEQMNKEKYDELKDLYETSMKTLLESIGATGMSAVDEQTRAANAEALFSFPVWPRVGEADW